MTHDAGYTLVEMLAALAMIGLSVSGMSAGLGVLGRIQATDSRMVSDLAAMRTGQSALEDLLTGQGPFRSLDADGLVGDASGFRFPCGPAGPCTAKIRTPEAGRARLEIDHGAGDPVTVNLPTVGPLAFAYVGGLGATAVWPPATADRQALRSVALVRTAPGAGEQPVILEARLWSEQPVDCAFDVVMQDCR